MKEIYLAGGCFWGTEHFIGLLHGVKETEVGYANSIVQNPDYRLVCTGTTESAETVRVVYEEMEITLPFLLEMFFKTIDPTSLNKQGNDVGTQYRTGIYYTDAADESVVVAALKKLQSRNDRPLQIEYGKLQNFYPAEEYHQDYLINNPRGYCHINRELMALAAKAKDPNAHKP